ncbi:MAG TPA: hypothetical protein PK388_10795, partial [Kiritimatiellia bacterium]|nr:hypothetical protein [Kiritimatiellia bacterium]
FQREPAARIVVLGDFNDEPSDRSIRNVLDVEPYPARSGAYETGKIYNLAYAKDRQGQGSFYHSFEGNVEWRMYDQIMASGALLQTAGDRRSEVTLWVDKPAFMVEEHGRDKGAPVPTFENQEDYLGGYSDHFPIGVRFAPAADATAAAPAEQAPAAEASAPAVVAQEKPAAPAAQAAPATQFEAPAKNPAAAKRAPVAPSRPAVNDDPVYW